MRKPSTLCRLPICAPLAALLAVACAPSGKTLRRELARGASGRYVDGVPFVRQRRNWCGPAALASVAQFHGLSLTQEQLAAEVYLESIAGTLTLDLEHAARQRGLWTHAGPGAAADVRRWLDRGVPVIALLRPRRPYHYVVVVGYHAGRGYFLAHTGDAADRAISYARFARQHGAGTRWLLAAAPPDRITWPLDADGHNDLALLLERQGKLVAASSHYVRAIAQNPRKAVFHFNLGNLHARRCPGRDAVRAYREAIRLAPDFADAHNNLACVLLASGRHDEARRHATRAVELGGPRVACYHDTLGRTLLALGRPADAVGAFRAAVKAAERDAATSAEARLGLIEALLEAGRRRDALAARDALLKSTDDPTVRSRADALLR